MADDVNEPAVGIKKERLLRRQRAKWWLVFHWRWLRGRGSRDGRTRLL